MRSAAHHVAGLVAGSQAVNQRFELQALAAARPRHRHRARTHNRRSRAPAPRSAPRRSRRPRQSRRPSPQTPGDLHRPIGAAGVDDDNLIENPPHRLQTGGRFFSSSRAIMVRLTLVRTPRSPARAGSSEEEDLTQSRKGAKEDEEGASSPCTSEPFSTTGRFSGRSPPAFAQDSPVSLRLCGFA